MKKMKITGPASTALRCFFYDIVVMLLGFVVVLQGTKAFWTSDTGERLFVAVFAVLVFPASILWFIDTSILEEHMIAPLILNPFFWAAIGYTFHRLRKKRTPNKAMQPTRLRASADG